MWAELLETAFLHIREVRADGKCVGQAAGCVGMAVERGLSVGAAILDFRLSIETIWPFSTATETSTDDIVGASQGQLS